MKNIKNFPHVGEKDIILSAMRDSISSIFGISRETGLDLLCSTSLSGHSEPGVMPRVQRFICVCKKMLMPGMQLFVGTQVNLEQVR